MKWTPGNQRYAVVAIKGGGATDDHVDEEEGILPDGNVDMVQIANPSRIDTKHNTILTVVYSQIYTVAKKLSKPTGM